MIAASHNEMHRAFDIFKIECLHLESSITLHALVITLDPHIHSTGSGKQDGPTTGFLVLP